MTPASAARAVDALIVRLGAVTTTATSVTRRVRQGERKREVGLTFSLLFVFRLELTLLETISAQNLDDVAVPRRGRRGRGRRGRRRLRDAHGRAPQRRRDDDDFSRLRAAVVDERRGVHALRDDGLVVGPAPQRQHEAPLGGG